MPSAGVLAVAGATLALALANALATPPFTGNDEAAHVSYALAVADGRLPEVTDRAPDGAIPGLQAGRLLYTANHPPLYYALVGPRRAALADSGRPVRRAALRADRERAVLPRWRCWRSPRWWPGWPRPPARAGDRRGRGRPRPGLRVRGRVRLQRRPRAGRRVGPARRVARRPPATAAAAGGWRVVAAARRRGRAGAGVGAAGGARRGRAVRDGPPPPGRARAGRRRRDRGGLVLRPQHLAVRRPDRRQLPARPARPAAPVLGVRAWPSIRASGRQITADAWGRFAPLPGPLELLLALAAAACFAWQVCRTPTVPWLTLAGYAVLVLAAVVQFHAAGGSAHGRYLYPLLIVAGAGVGVTAARAAGGVRRSASGPAVAFCVRHLHGVLGALRPRAGPGVRGLEETALRQAGVPAPTLVLALLGCRAAGMHRDRGARAALAPGSDLTYAPGMARRSQLRIYTVDPATSQEWVGLFFEHIVPLREQYGFSVDASYLSEDGGRFVWVTSHDCPDGWDAAESRTTRRPSAAPCRSSRATTSPGTTSRWCAGRSLSGRVRAPPARPRPPAGASGGRCRRRA